MTTCPHCGASVPHLALHCVECGQPLQAATIQDIDSITRLRDAVRSATTEPADSNVATFREGVLRTPSPQSEAPQSEAAQSEAAQSEAAQSEAAQSEAAQSEAAQSEAARRRASGYRAAGLHAPGSHAASTDVQTDADGPGDASAEDPAASDPATTVAAPAAAAALAAARVDDADGDDDDPASTLVVRTIPPDMPEPEGSHQAIIETLRGMEEWSAEHPAVAAKLARDVRTIPEDTAPTRERDAAKEAEARRESETPAATREGRRPGALPTPGDRVEGYEIIEEVGRGGMGRVYRARHRITEQEVALKMILPRYAEDPRQRRRFINEARVIAQLEHPNLVPLLGFVESESKTFIVMPFVRGVTLERLLRRQGRLELDAALDIFGQMCDAIQHVHSNDVLHRDLKPSNVIVREDGRVMVTDFGIARAVGSQRLTMTGMVVGTAEYVAPEHATGTVRDDPRSDIYALGVLLYEMVAGQVPFHHPNPAEVLRRHVSDEPPPLTTVVQGLSRAIEAAALKALEKDPADRYETAADFKRAVSRAHVHDEAPPRRRRRPVEPQRPRAGLPGGASVAIDPEPTDVVRRASEPSPPATTPGIAVWAAVIFFCAAAGISAWVLFRW